MKYYLFLIILLVACSAQETIPEQVLIDNTQVEEVEEVVENPVEEIEIIEEEIIEDAPPTPFRTEEVPTATVGSDVTELIERAEEKTAKGYAFTYYSEEDGTPGSYDGSRVFIRDEMIAIELANPQRIQGFAEAYTHIGYNKTHTTRYCPTCRSFTPQSSALEMIPIPNPLDWLNQIEQAEEISQQQYAGQRVAVLDATINDEQIEVFVHAFSGVPSRITVNGVQHSYQDIGLTAPLSAFEIS